MNALEAMASRRSIRRFEDRPVSRQIVEAILRAGTQAPSGKNRQPWRFVVVSGDQRATMVKILRDAVAEAKKRGESAGSADGTALVMERAPVTVFVFSPEGTDPWAPRSVGQAFQELVDVQSVGAAIENMLLAAQDLGLGSLWIADVFYAYEELRSWLRETGQMVAAVSFGYAAEKPVPRSRRPLGETARWL
ncbi:MAG: nitroreductase [Candidatus Bipolaricaulota bacterium]|nr:nitroreductase [Candidatus Bipolaricaulota bacterium]